MLTKSLALSAAAAAPPAVAPPPPTLPVSLPTTLSSRLQSLELARLVMVIVVPTTAEEEEILASLKAERDTAWQAFNPKQLSSEANDWSRFALANAKWLKCYQELYGVAPASDEVDRLSSTWWKWYRYERSSATEKPPRHVWQPEPASAPLEPEPGR